MTREPECSYVSALVQNPWDSLTLDGIGGSTAVTALTSLQKVDPGTPMPASAQYVVFVSSPQRELATERRAVRDFVEADPLLRKFFKVFLFENLPASGRRPDQTYLQQAEQAAIYVGLFGREYGAVDTEGISPTEREFDRATASGRERLIFVKGPDVGRDPRMAALVGRAGGATDPSAIHRCLRTDYRPLRQPCRLSGTSG
jgi:hypothetical protein